MTKAAPMWNKLARICFEHSRDWDFLQSGLSGSEMTLTRQTTRNPMDLPPCWSMERIVSEFPQNTM